MAEQFSVAEQGIVFNQLRAEQSRMDQFARQATPQLAQRVGDIYRNNPQMPAGVILSSAQAGLSDEDIKSVADVSATVVKKKKSWFQRNVADKVKTVSRYGMAAMDLPLQTLHGAAAQVFSPNDADGISGWFASTDLGSLIKNDTEAGDGYFLGGKAKQLQTQRVQNYRGVTEGGHGWSIGRGLAGSLFDEDSRAYNLMSGLVDGLTAVAVPVLPGFKTLAGATKTAAAAANASDMVRGADVAFDVLRGKGVRIGQSSMTGEAYETLAQQAGLVGKTVDPVQANKWLGSAGGRKAREKLAGLNTVDEVRGFVGENVYPETLRALRDATTDDAVVKVLIDVLGIPQAGLVSKKLPGLRKLGVSNARRVAVVDNLLGVFEDSRAGRISARAFSARPMRSIVDFSSSTPDDVRRTLNDVDRWLKASLADPTARSRFMDQALDAMTGATKTAAAQKALKEEFMKLIGASWRKAGVPDEVVEAILNAHHSQVELGRVYGATANGQFSSKVMYQGTFDPKGGAVRLGDVGDPLMASELGSFAVEMPDIRQVRGLTGKHNAIWRKSPKGDGTFSDENIQRLRDTGKLRLPFATAQFYQEEIFRKLVTATMGFGMRNWIEGQLSLALTNMPMTSIIRHPIEHMGWSAKAATEGRGWGAKVFSRKGGGDLSGVALEESNQYQHAVAASINSQVKDGAEPLRQAIRSGHVEIVTKGRSPRANIVQAHGDQIGLMNADPVMRFIASGDAITDDDIIKFIQTTPEGKKWFIEQQDYRIKGKTQWDQSWDNGAGAWRKQSVDIKDDHNLRVLIGEYRERLAVNIGDHTPLAYIVSSGLLPPKTVDAAKLGWDASYRGKKIEMPVGKGKRTRTVRVDANDENIIRPFAFKNGEATPELEKILDHPQVFDDPRIATEYAHEVRNPARMQPGGDLRKGFDNLTDRFFGFVARKPIAYLEKSPAFKQRFYVWADEMVTSLSPADLDKSIAAIIKKSAQEGMTPSQYLGDTAGMDDMIGRLFGKQFVGDRWQKMLDLQANPTKLKGSLTLDQVNEFAKGQALDDLKKITYDASERNNLTDISRAIMPFGQAQAEFFRRMARAYTIETPLIPLPNLAALRKTQLMIRATTEGDMDGDGRGFIYDDPQTGEKVFNYPLTGKLNKLFTSMLGGGPGVDATFQAPLKGALLALQINPGVGPVAQISTSMFLPDIPETDFIKKMILPYGETKMESGQGGVAGAVASAVMPSFAKKLFSAFLDKEESATVYGNTFMEVYQALDASTDYGLDAQGRDKLFNDAKWKAKYLVVLRGIGQFTGPSRPTTEMSVDVSPDAVAKLRAEGRTEDEIASLGIADGDAMVTVLAQELRKMQLEDYDSAIPRFLDIYGEQVFVYLSGKTKAVYGGLQASKQFGDFERSHKGLFRKYKNVAGYFTEGGTDLDWQVYNRQLETGMRERLSPLEMSEAAQRYVAFAQYRQVQELVGAYPNADQREYLTTFREYLGEQYPAFARTQYDPDKLKNDIAELTNALNDPSTPDNDVAKAAKLYLAARVAVLVEAQNRGLDSIDRSKNTGDLRGYLREYAETLKTDYPDFARLFDRLLLQEVDE